MPDDNTILTIAQVCHRLTVSESTFFRLAKRDTAFPRAVQISPRRVGYLKSEIDNFIAARQRKAA
jgi:predicted DNA-binding transcriptional regulator AlpA